jgi:hypothetical protein
MKSKLKDELENEFKPEFLNRIDDIVIFKSLIKDDIREIVNIMLSEVNTRLENKEITLKWDKSVISLFSSLVFTSLNMIFTISRISSFMSDLKITISSIRFKNSGLNSFSSSSFSLLFIFS